MNSDGTGTGGELNDFMERFPRPSPAEAQQALDGFAAHYAAADLVAFFEQAAALRKSSRVTPEDGARFRALAEAHLPPGVAFDELSPEEQLALGKKLNLFPERPFTSNAAVSAAVLLYLSFTAPGVVIPTALDTPDVAAARARLRTAFMPEATADG